ncbi:sugar phosphate isomerase/epimerase [Vibrio sp. S9_S30]|uniref:sugar phosphate isomerase/epimerase family protein n=1 Tax=Vibrio sp. S9_S30 TaxID=2720226 RepID=UPI0016811925|nr:sugar phosphate isomerase/epimerase family protein [Vibrio sp. S9_S30]MBD1556639.1 sugar phosphate isomerase/epimerase [Vibrio sp. S9_S30]
MMQLTAHTWMRPEPIKRSIERMAQVGIPAMELAGEPDWYTSTEVARHMKANGIGCAGTVTLTLGERNLCAGESAQREQTVEFMKKVVTMSKELGGTFTTVVPCTVGKITPDSTPEKEWAWLVDGLRELYSHAEKEGIRLGIEPLNRFEAYLINRADQAYALAKEVGPNCGVTLDVFHMHMEEADLFRPFFQCKDRLVNVHIAENNRFAPGMGQINWSKLLETLHAINYDANLGLEFMPTIDRSSVQRYGADQVEQDPKDCPPELYQFIVDHGSNLLSDSFYTSMFTTSIRTLNPLL